MAFEMPWSCQLSRMLQLRGDITHLQTKRPVPKIAASSPAHPALGKHLYISGPERIALSNAMDRFAAACYPEARVIHLKVWQARLLAKVIRNAELAEVTELIAYLDTAGQHGEPALANELYDAPAITLDDWLAMPPDEQAGSPIRLAAGCRRRLNSRCASSRSSPFAIGGLYPWMHGAPISASEFLIPYSLNDLTWMRPEQYR